MCSLKVPTPMGSCKCACCLDNCDCSTSDPSPTQKALKASTANQVSRERDKIEQFFRVKFAPMILKPKTRMLVAVVMLAWLIPAIIFVFQLRPTTEPEQTLSPRHPFQKAINVLNNNFGENSQDPGIDIYYIWGLKDIDRSNVNPLIDTGNLGKAQYADTFKFDSSCQDKIYQICQDLKFRNTTEDYLNMIQRNKKAEGSVKCFLFDLKDKFLKNSNIDREEPSIWIRDFMGTTVPQVDDEATSKMIPISEFYNTEGGLRIGWNGKELKFVAISIEAKSVTQWDRPSEDFMQRQYEMYDGLRANIDDIARDACGSEVIMTDRFDGMERPEVSKFVFMNNQKVYRTSSIRGALLGVAIAFIVLFFCTRDLMLAGFATLSILCTMMSVIGLVTMTGWKLGSIEAILISILAGFSVDYVVHLAHAYSHNFGSNKQRIIGAFSEMGSPVFSGMMTSILVTTAPFLCF